MNRWMLTVLTLVSLALLALPQTGAAQRRTTKLLPADGILAGFPAAVGCNSDQLYRRADSLRAQLEKEYHFIPRVGWDACDVLAHIGMPTRIETQESEYGRSASWWYETVGGMHLLSLAYRWDESRKGNRWIVDYVGW